MATLAIPSATARQSHGPLAPPHFSDTFLHAYHSLGGRPLVGSYRYFGLSIVAQNKAAARTCALEAHRAEEAGDARDATELLAQAIAHDQSGALDGDWLARRALLLKSSGNPAPLRAIELFNVGVKLDQIGLFPEAEQAYDSASALDPTFLWPANNTAWMLATSLDDTAHRSNKAILAAEWACARSGYGYWNFLGTLAAAFARHGDFDRAIAWQEVSLRLTPDHHRSRSERELGCYLCFEPWTDHAPSPAAGRRDVADPEQVDAEALIGQLEELRRPRGEALH